MSDENKTAEELINSIVRSIDKFTNEFNVRNGRLWYANFDGGTYDAENVDQIKLAKTIFDDVIVTELTQQQEINATFRESAVYSGMLYLSMNWDKPLPIDEALLKKHKDDQRLIAELKKQNEELEDKLETAKILSDAKDMAIDKLRKQNDEFLEMLKKLVGRCKDHNEVEYSAVHQPTVDEAELLISKHTT